MSDDKFATLSSAAMKEAAVAAVEIVEGAAGTVLGAIGGRTFELFELLGERNNEAIAAFRLGALEDEVIELRDELRALVRRLDLEGKKPDRQDPLTQAAVASEFVRGVSEATTTEKREALVHATAHQFDPDKGSPGIRDYWLRRVREIPEGELALVLLLARVETIVFLNDGRAYRANSELLDLSVSDRVAYAGIARRFQSMLDPAQLIITRNHHTIQHEGVTIGTAVGFTLTEAGKIFVAFCKGD